MKSKIKRLFFISVLTMAMLLSVSTNSVSALATPSMTLTVVPNPSGNYVALNWNNIDRSQPYNYMLYSKSSLESTFQSIPAKNTVRVLNIFPDVTPTVSFKTWKGESCTLPKSASLKMWMETPNEYNAKGYGEGLISVDAVSISLFNVTPDSYLKNQDGTYKYDVLYFGAWDANNFQDLSNTAQIKVDTFIKTGRGVLFGHDTMVLNDTIAMPNFFNLAHYVNIETISKYTVLGGTQINVSKKGLLTNYPWKIGEPGTVLNVPMSHTNQLALGDVWMTYQPPYTYSGGTPQTNAEGKGTNAFYLTTWCNAAMIQTGHSNGAATPDEQRVTANTLFYLAQITTDTSWNDHKGQDLSVPDAPAVSGVTHNADCSQYTVAYSSSDNAMDYQYYVEATGQNDGVKFQSPVVAASIKSGMKGYSIVVDNNPSTVPNGAITTAAGNYTFSRPSGGNFYIHIAAVDNVGNVSQVTHYNVNELISVTHPISVNYSINPNNDTPFIASEIPITNNSGVPVKVSIQSLSASSGGSVRLNDVTSSKYADWSKLTVAQTKSDLALGIHVKETAAGTSSWSAINDTDLIYATDLSSKTLLGTLNPNGAKGTLALSAKCGLAWDKSYTASHSLVLLFELSK
ncbi:DUF5057 domain-containing protein [Faecalispora anaeroviscerum]|uniref:DUF5057 domain-containing protein n=1 Tax=Faecalispora anaeroviscerum TaxID=2991836 RepID=UPI0024B9ED91|nr:DUF5057 domain-containing protein [Faecalispora anaeroviscerum]